MPVKEEAKEKKKPEVGEHKRLLAFKEHIEKKKVEDPSIQPLDLKDF